MTDTFRHLCDSLFLSSQLKVNGIFCIFSMHLCNFICGSLLKHIREKEDARISISSFGFVWVSGVELD